MDNEAGGPPGKSPGLEADVRWLSYTEIAALRGISRNSAERIVRRSRWRRQVDNQGVTKVAVPLAYAEPVRASPPEDSADSPPESHPDIDRLVRLLEAVNARSDDANKRADIAIALADRTVAQLADATARIEQAERRADHAAARAGALETDLRAKDAQLTEHRLAADQARAEAEEIRRSAEARITSLETEAQSARGVAQEAVQAAEALQANFDELKAGQGRHASELEQARTEAQETRKAAEAHIANLEADAAAKDAWIAQAETDLDVARRDVETARQAAAEVRLADTTRKARGRLRRAWDGWRGR